MSKWAWVFSKALRVDKVLRGKKGGLSGTWDKRDGSTVDPADTAGVDRLGSSGAASKAICKFRRKARGVRGI